MKTLVVNDGIIDYNIAIHTTLFNGFRCILLSAAMMEMTGMMSSVFKCMLFMFPDDTRNTESFYGHGMITEGGKFVIVSI